MRANASLASFSVSFCIKIMSVLFNCFVAADFLLFLLLFMEFWRLVAREDFSGDTTPDVVFECIMSDYSNLLSFDIIIDFMSLSCFFSIVFLSLFYCSE